MHALFEKLERFFERQFSLFEFLHDVGETLHVLFERCGCCFSVGGVRIAHGRRLYKICRIVSGGLRPSKRLARPGRLRARAAFSSLVRGAIEGLRFGTFLKATLRPMQQPRAKDVPAESLIVALCNCARYKNV
jgi:hypothetical protein